MSHQFGHFRTGNDDLPKPSSASYSLLGEERIARIEKAGAGARLPQV
jgi:hypothetical protein